MLEGKVWNGYTMANKSLSSVPEGYHTVNPWVIPKGAARFIQFVEEVFEAKEKKDARIPDDDGLLIHAEVEIGDSVIMIFDSKDDWLPTPSFLQVYVEDAEAVLRRARETGAEIVIELSDFVYGEKLARFRDPWGNLWWINLRTEEIDWEAEAARVQEELKDSAKAEEMSYIKETLIQAMRHVEENRPEANIRAIQKCRAEN